MRVTPWNPAGQTLAQLEEAAKAFGWWQLHEHPDAPAPDLVVVAVPPGAQGRDTASTYRSYGWVLNWSQDMGKPNRWDCLVVLPSVAQPNLTADELAREALARQVIVDRDLPSIDRATGNTAPTAELFERALARLLADPAR